MNSEEPARSILGTLRKPAPISVKDVIRAETLYEGNPLPLVIEPRMKGVILTPWARANREWIEKSLLEHGAILFRNFSIREIEDFELLIQAISDQSLEYRERSSPRRLISGKIYTSTDYPKKHRIFPHNENSYQRTWPLKLFFFCLIPPLDGGETLITNCRRVLERIPPQIRARFEEKNWKYTRNFGDGFGLEWPEVFQTTDKTVVEEHCRNSGITVEWKAGDRLKISAVRPAFAKHPQTLEPLWFNHATFFHVTTLEPAVRDELLLHFEPGDLPTNSYYGDSSPIEASVLEHLREAYIQETVSFPWQAGDVLLLDNMLTGHGRAPYSGPRSIGVGMAEPITDTRD
jgi:alpha-ketoglutarate-dependent taurine dioxygenase